MFLLLLTTTHLVTASPPTSCISGEPLPKPSPLPPDLQYLQWSQIDRAVFYNCYEKVVEFYDEYEGEPWRIPHASLKIGAHEGHVKIVEALLERKLVSVVNCGVYPWLAAKHDHPQVLKLLLEAGYGTGGYFPAHCSGVWYGLSPLYAAAMGGSVESLRLLLEAGADVNIWGRDRDGPGSVLEVAMKDYNSPVEVARFLLEEAGAKINLETTLSVAAGYGDLEIVKILLERGSNVNQPDRGALKTAREEWEKDLVARINESTSHLDPTKYEDHYYEAYYEAQKRIESAMWRNVSVDHLMYAKKIHFTYNRYHIDRVNLSPPIIEASKKGHSEIVELLLDHGADVEILTEEPFTGRSGNVSLAVAARGGHTDVVRVLLEHGARVDGPPPPQPGDPPYFPGIPLTEAVESNSTAAAKLLIDAGANLFPEQVYDGGDNKSISLLHEAAKLDNVDILRLLLDNGYSVDDCFNIDYYVYRGVGSMQPREDNDTALAFAADTGSANAAEFLVGMGANVNAHNNRGWTPLHFAAQNGHNDVATILIEAGADLELRAMFYHSWDYECKPCNSTALQIAISKGHDEVVGSLVAAGADVEVKDLFDALPPQEVDHETPDILRYLLSSGASPDVLDESGDTLLMYAAWNGYRESFRILLAAGVDLDKKGSLNQTALTLARNEAKVINSGKYPGPDQRDYKSQYKRQCIIIEELLAAGAKDEDLGQPSLPDIPEKCAQIGRDGSAPDCPYEDHCEDWGPVRAAVHYGCLDQLDQLISSSGEQPIREVTTHQLRDAAKRCFAASNITLEQRRQMSQHCDEASLIHSCISSMERRGQVSAALNFCIFDVNNMTAEERKEFVVNNFGNEQMSSSEFDVYSIFFSQHGSLLYTAAVKGDQRTVEMLLSRADTTGDLLEAVHAASRETALDAAVRLCNPEVVRDLTSAGADILHQVLAPGFGQLDRLPLLHRTIQGDSLTCGYCPKKPVEILQALLIGAKKEDLESTDEGQNTPIIWAARFSMNHMLEVLIRFGADVNYQGATESLDRRGIKNSTALHWAVRNKNKEAIEMLIAAGANPSLRDSGEYRWAQGGARWMNLRSPLEWATELGLSEDIVDILQNGKDE